MKKASNDKSYLFLIENTKFHKLDSYSSFFIYSIILLLFLFYVEFGCKKFNKLLFV